MVTVLFFLTAAATTQILHRGSLSLTADADWSLGGRYGHVYALNATLIPLLVAILCPPTLVPDVKTVCLLRVNFSCGPRVSLFVLWPAC